MNRKMAQLNGCDGLVKSDCQPAFVVSLIIPVYNAERYIVDCVESIVWQLQSGCEVIFVDDGTPDLSIDLITERYQEYFENRQFKLIRIANSGPGAARNVGIRASSGDYIGFLDSDDVMLPGYFHKVLDAILTTAADLVQFHVKRFSGSVTDANAVELQCHRTYGVHRLEDVRNEIFGIGYWFPCCRVYKRKLLLEQPFVENEFYEDLMTIPFIFMNECSINLLNECLVGYRVNPAGTTANHNSGHATSLINFFQKISLFETTTPSAILKVKVGRTISYFVAELGFAEDSLGNVIRSIGLIPRKHRIIKYLSLPDIFFILAPRFYVIFDIVRLRLLKNVVKIFRPRN